jgi:hypothetical protein
MPFTEEVKLQVKYNAAFKCCFCQTFGIDVHHIISESEGGPSIIDNAAPLCQNCHDRYGDNPQKRKLIREARDWWYIKCEELFKSPTYDPVQLSKIETKLEGIEKLIQPIQEISELKSMLREVSERLIDSMTPSTAHSISSAIVNASTSATAVQLGEKVYTNFQCRKCNTFIGLLVGTDKCPDCGSSIN